MRNDEDEDFEDEHEAWAEDDDAAEEAAAIEAEECALQAELEYERETLEGDVGSELDDKMEWDDWETGGSRDR